MTHPAKTLAPLLLAATLLPLSAFAQEKNSGLGIYVAPKFIYGQVKTSYRHQQRDGDRSGNLSHSERAAGWGLSAGYDFNTKFSIPMRIELEYMGMGDTKKTRHQTSNVDLKSTVSASAMLVNIYYDFRNPSPFIPYAGAGLGYGSLSIKGALENKANPDQSEKYGKKTTNNFAWGIGAGCAWQATKFFALDLGYRYANFGKAESKYYVDPNYNSGNPTDNDTRLKSKKVEAHQFLLNARFTF